MKTRNRAILLALVVAGMANVTQVVLSAEQGRPNVDFQITNAKNGTSRATKLSSGTESVKYSLRVTPPDAICDMQIERWKTGAEGQKEILLPYAKGAIKTTTASSFDPGDTFYPPAGYTIGVKVKCVSGGAENVSELTLSR